MTKKIIRNQVLDRLNTMARTKHKELSLKIANQVVASNEFRNADTIGITISRFPEVDTRPIIDWAWKTGKRIAVPKCHHATREMDFRLITSYKSLEIVYSNLLEPVVEETVPVGKAEIDLQIVPGVVFSAEGYRVGFGGGFYDRYMADYKGNTLSLAFECQTNHSVPVEPHDMPVRKIFTDEKVLSCQGIEGEN